MPLKKQPLKLSQPKVIRDGSEPLTHTEKMQNGIVAFFGMILAGLMYLTIAGLLIFAVGFAICMSMLSGVGNH